MENGKLKMDNSQLSISTYPLMKDSGVEWIGEIPAGWEVKKLKYVTSINDDTLAENTDGDFEIEYVDISNVKSGLGILATETYAFSKAPSRARRIVQNGDVIVSTVRTYLKSISKINNQPDNLIVSTGFAVIRAKEIKSDYIGFLFYSEFLIGEIISRSTGVSYPAINASEIGEIFIPIPEECVQTTIANYLDRKTAEIDELIAQKERLLELYEEEKTAIINQAVTKGIDPDVKLKDSTIDWLGEIPEGWEVKKLKYVGEFINGYSFGSGDFISTGVRVLKISNIQHMRIDWSDASYIDESFYEDLPSFRVYRNDLVFALTRPIISTGIKASLIDDDEKILINQRNSIFRTNSIEIKWIFYMLLSKQFINDFDKRIDKTGQQPNISSNAIGDINIPVPSPEDQLAIVHHIETETTRINAKIAKTKKIIALQKEYRIALISEVVTGKIKVIQEAAA